MAVQPLFAPRASRDMAMDKLKESMECIRLCYDRFFEGKFEENGFRDQIRKCKDLLTECEPPSPMTDTALENAGCVRQPFKKGL
eukprot:CAMPEP_0198579244 /NCGR_PEP_ID=MMETSP1462-20131121/121299_1 /TAXON_ID=1333877 /ORGANISM="Brandtodinium nutriculum, Strain RCC3387" /LENGTH=83 /DNA_ID=CAMNT_0044310565 /DNA_START=27 /DNA_END=275 /DNA_ORIENTATION=-